jgi:mannonate dehydratase
MPKKLAAKNERGAASPLIRNIRVITTAPDGLRLIAVRVDTNQPGLYGYGCATFTQRAEVVVTAIEQYLKPLLIGQPADRIEDLWQLAFLSSYWRNSGVLNNAMSGIDLALWDIKGRQAGMPVYQLLGGKCREAVACYGHAGGMEISEILESVQAYMAQGFRHIRVQFGLEGQSGYGAGSGANYNQIGSGTGRKAKRPSAVLHNDEVFQPGDYVRKCLRVMGACRSQLPAELEILHDVHERLAPANVLQLARELEPFRLFFLEDPLPPEENEWLRNLRTATTTPIAMGELFNSPQDWMPLVRDRLIDFIRIHVTQLGGLTPCRKVAHVCEAYGVRTAWHGPGDMTPMGHAANVALDLVSPNFGIQEWAGFSEKTSEIFSGLPEFRDGYVYAREAPGWGIEINEKAARRYPFGHAESGERARLNGGWGAVRLPDGTVIRQ